MTDSPEPLCFEERSFLRAAASQKAGDRPFTVTLASSSLTNLEKVSLSTG